MPKLGSLQSSTKGQDQVQYITRLNFVLLCRLIVGHLFAAENQTLLRRWNALLLLHALLNALNLRTTFRKVRDT